MALLLERRTPGTAGTGERAVTVRVVELTQRFPPARGGVEQHVDHLARELVRAGIEVQVVTTDLARDRPFGRVRGVGNHGEFPVRRHRAMPLMPAPHGLGILAPGMLFSALEKGPDVLHAHAFGYFPTWSGALARRLRPVKLVITPHMDAGRGSAISRTYARLVARATLRPADRVIAQTPSERDLLQRCGVDPTRIEVIPTAIDLEEFASLPARPPVAPRPVLLFVGRIYLAQKGLDLLLRATARLEEPVPDLRLVGEDWGDMERLRRLAHDLGLSDRLTLTGPLSRSEVLREYARADAFVLPSRFDSFPVVLLEAMAAHLPIVATRVGGVPDVVRDGENGWLVPPNDVGALAEALRRVLRDATLRRTMGAEARSLVDAYSWARIGPRYASLFRDLSNGGRA
ncbi:MAG: glycosyltransferase family 4 protein [Thermoplasmata archaeon]|nr:glycosyltransferase family 4 protein [Thermoplasmata archaeon]